jgi:hypothetical protein
MIAPSKPTQYIPPATARPVRYGCPPLKKYIQKTDSIKILSNKTKTEIQ